MAANALDLSPLDEALRDLMRLTSGHSAAELMEEAGRIVQSQWRDNIMTVGFIDTGRFLDGIVVNIIHDDERGAWVEVGSTAQNQKTTVPYPIMLEYGWTPGKRGTGRTHRRRTSGPATIPGRPTGRMAFAMTRAKVVRGVSSTLGRKLTSRKKRYR